MEISSKGAYCGMSQNSLLPLVPLDLVLLPGEMLPFQVFEMGHRRMISKCHSHGSEFGIVLKSGEEVERVGCTAKVRDITERLDDDRFDVRVIGSRRFIVHTFDLSAECLRGAVEYFSDEVPDQASVSEVEAMLALAEEVGRLTGSKSAGWDLNHPSLSFRVAADLPASEDLKQQLLRTTSEVDRVELVTIVLQAMIAMRDREERRAELVSGNGRMRH